MAVYRPHIDERPAFLPIHVLDAGFCRQKRAIEMNRYEFLEIREWKRLYWVHDLDARIGNEGVDTAPLRRDPVDACVHGLLVGDIHFDNHCLGARRFVQGGGGLLGAVDVDIADSNPAALASEAECNLTAYA